MMKRQAIIGVCFLTALILTLHTSHGFTQSKTTEELVLTTYYPVPYGDYQNLRLVPTQQDTACSADNRGTMYYDEAADQIKVCRRLTNGTYSWQSVGLWKQNGNSISPDDNNWRVAVGSDTVDYFSSGPDAGKTVGISAKEYISAKDVWLKDPKYGNDRWASDSGIEVCSCSNSDPNYYYYWYYYYYYGNPSCNCPTDCSNKGPGYTSVQISSGNSSPYWWYYYYGGSQTTYYLCIPNAKVTSGGYNYSWPWWWYSWF